jgi:hypothetical protein
MTSHYYNSLQHILLFIIVHTGVIIINITLQADSMGGCRKKKRVRWQNVDRDKVANCRITSDNSETDSESDGELSCQDVVHSHIICEWGQLQNLIESCCVCKVCGQEL